MTECLSQLPAYHHCLHCGPCNCCISTFIASPTVFYKSSGFFKSLMHLSKFPSIIPVILAAFSGVISLICW
jgi:hypothetical protein